MTLLEKLREEPRVSDLAKELRALADDLDGMRDALLPFNYSGTSKPAVALVRRAAAALERYEEALRWIAENEYQGASAVAMTALKGDTNE